MRSSCTSSIARVAADGASACAILSDAGLAGPAATVVRSLLDGFIGTYWATLSEANGRAIIGAMRQELARIVQLNPATGDATVRHRKTGANRTGSFLKHLRTAAEAERLPRFDRVATQAGLRRVYDNFYGVLSLFGHGAATELLAGDQEELLHAAAGLTRCLRAVLQDRVRERRHLAPSEVATILGVPL